MKAPEVFYARSGDVSIAYQVVGDGPVDLVFVRGLAGELLSTWEQPLLVAHVMGFASFSRVLMLDKRGTGLSDRVREVPTLETRMDDVRTVMDAVGSDRAFLWSGQEGGRMTTLFAATYPERTAGLILLDPSAKGLRSGDYPWAPTEAEWHERLRDIREGWGRREFFDKMLAEMSPEIAGDEEFLDWFVAHMRRSLSPGAAVAFQRMMMDADVTEVLPAVRVPTLIIYMEGNPGPARYFAERIPNAELVELPGLRGVFTWVHPEAHALTLRATREFIDRVGRREEPDRVLATVLFTDIVGSTERAAQLGDRAWRELLERHHAIVRGQLARFRGQEIDTAGDGFFASFDGPARAIRCACAVRDALRQIGIDVRAGLHTGECEIVAGKIAGIAVNVGARVAALAGPAEVLVSSTVKDLVAGSGIEFEDRGEHELKGIPGAWRVFAVAVE